ncbi:cathepsin L-like [Anticarsia gemmatalis]|uniref:cathepsin L-like n=1 Tax=Anticarsia gemmatalis TaxID=129554 RepID=UPI003F7700D8
MKYMLLLLSACWCASAIQPEMYSLLDAGRHFVQFTQRFNKHYHSDEERAARFQIFKNNLLQANRLNKESDNAVFGISKFMDLTADEFIRQYTGVSMNGTSEDMSDTCRRINDRDIPRGGTPPFLDFRLDGYVTAVKDQESCGSCYVFAAIGNIEAQCAKKFGVLRPLSEQQVIDCNKRSDGCHGGKCSDVFWSLMEQGGAVPQADYPYIAKEQQCKHPRATALISGCRFYNLHSQKKLQLALFENGPISITMEPARLHLFTGRTLTDSMCYASNQPTLHGVLLVGYGTDEQGVDYWLLKNSWGANWGDNGYFRVQRGEGAYSCGMMKYLSSSADVSACY